MLVFFSKQKTAYEMRISDWSSDVCSSDLHGEDVGAVAVDQFGERDVGRRPDIDRQPLRPRRQGHLHRGDRFGGGDMNRHSVRTNAASIRANPSSVRPEPVEGLFFSSKKELGFDKLRSEEHTSELQSLMRISYAVFCLKKKKNKHINN